MSRETRAAVVLAVLMAVCLLAAFVIGLIERGWPGF